MRISVHSWHVIDAMLRHKCLDEPADQLPKRLDDAGRALARCRFEFGECLLDRVEVRQLAHAYADRINRLAHAIDLVGAQIVREDHSPFFRVGVRICSTYAMNVGPITVVYRISRTPNTGRDDYENAKR
jgi:hypothetical protein